MKTKKITLPQISKADFSVSHVELEAASPLNQNEPHIHAECEIYVNLTGDVAFEVENRIYPVSRGSVIITRPYEYHHCIYLSDKPHDHYWITFSAEETDWFLKMFFGREKGKDNLILLEEAQLEALCGILEALLEREEDALRQRVRFLQMLCILSEGKVEDYVGDIAQMSEDVALALQYMDGHLMEELDIATLAGACNVSVNTLERHFKETFQMTPFGMLRRKRLFASLEYLRGGASVAEAASESGFSDYSNYIQLFRKQFGITPLRYKKKFALK